MPPGEHSDLEHIFSCVCWSWIWCDRSGKIESWQSIYTTGFLLRGGNETQAPSHCFHASVNLKCIFKWTVGLFGSINYSNCFLRGNHMWKRCERRVCERRRVWDRCNSPLKIFFFLISREGACNEQQHLHWRLQCSLLPHRCLAFHVEIKASAWSCSSFSHVADMNSTSNRKKEGQVWLSARKEWEIWQQQEHGLSSH